LSGLVNLPLKLVGPFSQVMEKMKHSEYGPWSQAYWAFFTSYEENEA
jgi:hypothetical protein